MKLLLCLLLCFCVFQINLVESGELLNKLSSGLSQTRQGITCGFHKFGNTFLKHDHHNDPCQDHEHPEDNNKIDNERESHKTTSPTINVRSQDATSSVESSTIQGRRIISVGSNCPPGQRGDGRGHCREEY